MRSDVLTAAKRDGDHAFLGLHGDSLAANKLLIAQVELETQGSNILLQDGWCVGHQLSIVADEQMGATGEDLINPVFATKKLMQQTQPRQQLHSGYDSLSKRALVLRGIQPPARLQELHREIVRQTIGDGQFETLFAVRDPVAVEHGRKEEALLELLLQLFNGDWELDRWQHYCVRSLTDRRPCCISIQDSKNKMAQIMKDVSSQAVWDKLKEGTKKWCESPRRASKLGLLTSVHNYFGQAVQMKWMDRQPNGSASDSSDEHLTDSYHAQKRKRKSKAVKFWSRKKARGLLIVVGIASKPIRVLLGKHFAAEREARLRASLAEDFRSPSLMGQFTGPGGHLDTAYEELNNLLSADSPLLAKHCCPDMITVTIARGMILRAIGGLKYRLSRRMKRKTSLHECVVAIDNSNEEAWTAALMSANQCCLEAYWERRTQKAFKEDQRKLHIRPQDQMLPGAHFRDMMVWVGNRHPLFVISARETDHAALVNKLRSTRWWTQSILPLMVDQQLEHWLAILPKHVALNEGMLSEARALSQKTGKKVRKNQHSGGASREMMLPQVINLVNTALPELARQRQGNVGTTAAGTYVAYRADELKKAKLQSPGGWDIQRMAEFNKAL